MKSIIALLALTATAAVAVEPDTFVCSKGGEERRIEVQYPSGESLPCEVSYQKYGGVETLWTAHNTEGYCFVRALELVEKHRGWGWQCEQQAAEVEIKAAHSVTQ
ncbi:hypothetical protein [Ferrimonas lipolytica]|uniref:SH3 domain-containing protein n=1 Tax=Ferrimonas lipolytica TaxID=2724191 RepID=A0A6H1UJU3_9GAMM|nr:hypothetical protein [Ferrimonas lipolytica]QIZ78583.1 hypothetical protein HER31_17755 [Ferrimonas lipolytica]